MNIRSSIQSKAFAFGLPAAAAAASMLVPATPALAWLPASDRPTLTLAALQARGATLTYGEWEGEQSRNRVRIEARPEGIWVAPVTQHAGQTVNGFLYRSGSDGTYRFRFPDGNESVVTVLSADRLRLRNPDGWTDVFRWQRR